MERFNPYSSNRAARPLSRRIVIETSPNVQILPVFTPNQHTQQVQLQNEPLTDQQQASNRLPSSEHETSTSTEHHETSTSTEHHETSTSTEEPQTDFVYLDFSDLSYFKETCEEILQHDKVPLSKNSIKQLNGKVKTFCKNQKIYEFKSKERAKSIQALFGALVNEHKGLYDKECGGSLGYVRKFIYSAQYTRRAARQTGVDDETENQEPIINLPSV